MRRRAAHEELTDDANTLILGTLTPRGWGQFAILAAQARFYDPDVDLDEVEHPLKAFLHEARRTSGSISGEHRKDLVEAIKAGSIVAGVPAQPVKGEDGAREGGRIV